MSSGVANVDCEYERKKSALLARFSQLLDDAHKGQKYGECSLVVNTKGGVIATSEVISKESLR